MSNHESITHPPLTDNPWFWAYLFGTAGLVGVMLLGAKFDSRQEQLDANFTRRQELLEQRADPQQPIQAEALAPEQEERYVKFSPLYIALALGTGAAWIALWRQHFRNVPQSNAANEQVST